MRKQRDDVALPADRAVQPARKPKTGKETAVNKQQEIKLVTNVGRMTQHIGGVEIEPGKSRQVDVSPGTVGKALVDSGVLVEGKGTIRKPIITADDTVQKQSGDVPIPGIYICPFCGEKHDDSEKAKFHFFHEHKREIVVHYLELIAKSVG